MKFQDVHKHEVLVELGVIPAQDGQEFAVLLSEQESNAKTLALPVSASEVETVLLDPTKRHPRAA